MTSQPDSPKDSGAPFADTVEEIVGKLESYTCDRIQNKVVLGPVPTRLHLTVRPLGSHMTMQREIPIDTGRKQHQFPSQWVRDELGKIFRAAEKMSAKKRTLSVEVVSEFGVKIVDIRVNTAGRVRTAVSGATQAPVRGTVSSPVLANVAAPPPVSEVEPTPEPAPQSTPEPAPAPAPDSAPELAKTEPEVPEPDHAPSPEPEPSLAPEPTPEPAGAASAEVNPDLIDFSTMKYFPTDMTHKVVRKTLLAGGITTKQQLLELLGTTEPTRIDWEIFIKKLSTIARDAGFKFFSSSDGTLYWWLTKRMKWIKPFSGNP